MSSNSPALDDEYDCVMTMSDHGYQGQAQQCQDVGKLKDDDALHAQNLRTITQAFVDGGRGLFWDLCQGDLESAFAQALEIVDEGCIEIDPQ